MKYSAYPAYKDSGVEWLGEIPEHWEVKKFRYCAKIPNGQIDPRKNLYKDMILIAPNHIESGTGRVLYKQTADEQGADSGKYLFKKGDVLYSKIRPALKKACLALEEGLCSADMYPLTPQKETLSKFLLFVILSEWFTRFAVLESERVAMPKVNRESLNNGFVVLPPQKEQQAIAFFLDRETAKIDALIAKEYRILIVADKFQTGFDQPLLHTMYVDKPLRDIKAVQTLSRLNRCHPGKNETMVLDFVNDWQTIKNAFQGYYTATTLSEGTEPNRLYTLQRQLKQFGFYDTSELDNVTNIYYRNPQAVDQLEAAISPVFERFDDAEEDNQNRFRDLLTEYVRLYLYLSQIVKFTDVDLEKLYILGHLLLTKIQPSQQESPFTLPQGIELEAYRIQETFSGSIKLDNTPETELPAPVIKGSGTPAARTAVPLSQVIQEFNNRYGVNLTDADKVCVETVTDRLSQNVKLKQQVQVNADKAQTTFNETAQKLMLALFREKIPGFQDFYSKTKKNKDFERALLTWMFAQFIDKVKEPNQGEAEDA